MSHQCLALKSAGTLSSNRTKQRSSKTILISAIRWYVVTGISEAFSPLLKLDMENERCSQEYILEMKVFENRKYSQK